MAAYSHNELQILHLSSDTRTNPQAQQGQRIPQAMADRLGT